MLATGGARETASQEAVEQPQNGQAATPETVRALATDTPVRRNPDIESEVIAHVKAGSVLVVTKREGDWLQVALPVGADGELRHGYVAANSVERLTIAGLDRPRTGVQIILLNPLILIEDVRDGSELSPLKGGAADLAPLLRSAARSAAESRGYSVVDDDSLQDADALSACGQLGIASRKLARGVLDDDLRHTLGLVAQANDGYAVLAQAMRIRIGPGRSWNPWTGNITSSMSNTVFQASLISASTAEVLWKNELLVRKLPQPTDKRFMSSLHGLYGSLPSREK